MFKTGGGCLSDYEVIFYNTNQARGCFLNGWSLVYSVLLSTLKRFWLDLSLNVVIAMIFIAFTIAFTVFTIASFYKKQNLQQL